MTEQIANAIEWAINNDADEVAMILANACDKTLFKIVSGEKDEIEGTSGEAYAVVEKTLTHDGNEVVSWTRCAVGYYGKDGEWTIEEDTNGGDGIPDIVEAVIRALGLEEDCIPDVQEPPLATEIYHPDDCGEYAVYWETVGDDERLLARYGTWEEANAVCLQRSREFARRNPGNMLCGYGVRELEDGEWVPARDNH